MWLRVELNARVVRGACRDQDAGLAADINADHNPMAPSWTSVNSTGPLTSPRAPTADRRCTSVAASSLTTQPSRPTCSSSSTDRPKHHRGQGGQGPHPLRALSCGQGAATC